MTGFHPGSMNSVYFITEQRDSNLWCNVIVMITCDIIVKSGKNIIAVNIKVLKENVTWLSIIITISISVL